MNHNRLAVYCDISPGKAIEVSLQTIADYLALLYRVARTGGPSIEEEIFVESLAASMEVDAEILEKAIQQSKQTSEDIHTAAAKLRATPLLYIAYLDACHLTRLDRELTAEESHALKEIKAGLELQESLAEKAYALAKRQDRFLHIFCSLAEQPDPADLWKVYLHEGLRQSDRQRRMILRDPATPALEASEKIAALAVLMKLIGIGRHRGAQTPIVDGAAKFLGIDTEGRAEAAAKAWSMDASLSSLSDNIRDRRLQLVTLGDAHRICISDTELSPLERKFLEELTAWFGFTPEHCQNFFDLTYDEVAFRKTVKELIQAPQKESPCDRNTLQK